MTQIDSDAAESGREGLLKDLGLALAGAFAFRLLFLIISPRVIDMADAIHYINMARQFGAGQFTGFDDNLPILYPALGALAHLVLPDWEWAFWAVSLLASTCLVAPVYLLARELFGRKTAQMATVLICLWPWLVDYAGRITPDALATLLWFVAIWLLYTGIEGGRTPLFLAPLAFFALHLARPEGTFILLGAPFGGLILCYGRERIYLKRLLIFACVALGFLALYAITMRLMIGTYTVSYRAPMTGDWISYLRNGGIEFARTFLKLFFDVFPIMLNIFLLVFLGAGLFHPAGRTRRYRLEFLVFFFCALQCCLTLANLSPAPRYVMTVIVALSLWSARGITVVSAQAEALPYGRWLRRIPAVLVVGSFLLGIAAGFAAEATRGMPGLPREYKIAGRWMQENLEPGFVICRKPQVGYYADMPTTGPALTDGPAEVVARAKAIGARYLVLDERYTVNMIPGLRPLLDPTQAPPELKLLRADLSPWPGAKIVIYQVVAPGIRYLTRDEFPNNTSHMGPYDRRRKPVEAGQ